MPPPPPCRHRLHGNYLTGLERATTVDFTLLVDSFFWGSTLNHVVALSNSFHAPCMPHPMLSQCSANAQQCPVYAQPKPSLCLANVQPIKPSLCSANAQRSLCSAKAQPMRAQPMSSICSANAQPMSAKAHAAYAQPMSSLRSTNAQPMLYCLRCPANA